MIVQISADFAWQQTPDYRKRPTTPDLTKQLSLAAIPDQAFHESPGAAECDCSALFCFPCCLSVNADFPFSNNFVLYLDYTFLQIFSAEPEPIYMFARFRRMQ
jgi:hypothetical protein